MNDLIKMMKKMEVRKQGADARARRPLEMAEFEQMLEISKGRYTQWEKVEAPTILKFQFNLIARCDDSAHFKKEELKPNANFPFALNAHMCWSKNILEERKTPDQIMLGASNKNICILIGLAIHLESTLQDPGE